MPCDDCSRTEACPPCPHEPDPHELCNCGHERWLHVEGICLGCPQGHGYLGIARHRFIGPKGLEEAEEPPLTSEEEEEAPEDCVYGDPLDPSAETRSDGPCSMKELPPQPERRPPLIVAYSVQGHLYEVALSGDATVRAEDGALVIRHALGAVAGIVQTAPLTSEES